MPYEQVPARLERIRSQLAEAARAAGRPADSVVLLAVSKAHPAAAIRVAYEAGQRDFGENYAQELVAKAAELADLPGLRWHFIGHLQSNKARDVAQIAAEVHAIDRSSLADALARRASQTDRTEPLGVYVEVNVAGEASKSGCSIDEAKALAEHIRTLSSLRLRGFMTIPPAGDDDRTRSAFSALAELRDASDPTLGLSMGMSSDFAVAIGQGATVVRIGTSIFGPRPPRRER